MPYNLRNRSFVKEIDFSPAELRFLLKLSQAHRKVAHRWLVARPAPHSVIYSMLHALKQLQYHVRIHLLQ